jgi:hypothetical protein
VASSKPDRSLHDELCRRLGEIGVEHRAWPGREDGFAALLHGGKELGHFHHWAEIDLRLGKDLIAREGLSPLPDSTVHPERAANSPWYELRLLSRSDVDEAVRLVQLAVAAVKKK